LKAKQYFCIAIFFGWLAIAHGSYLVGISLTLLGTFHMLGHTHFGKWNQDVIRGMFYFETLMTIASGFFAFLYTEQVIPQPSPKKTS
jgi:hypothetical protein